MNTHWCLVATIVCLWPSPVGLFAQITIADSVSDFSGVQGHNNWYYGYYAAPFGPADFQEMQQYTGGIWYAQQFSLWTSMNANWEYPNGTAAYGGAVPIEQWSARRYVSEVAGLALVTGTISDLDHRGPNSNGVVARIFVNSDEVFSSVLENGDTNVTYQIPVSLSHGTVIDFVVDPRDSNERFDRTEFSATITVPEPGIRYCSFLGFIIAICVGWRRPPKRA